MNTDLPDELKATRDLLAGSLQLRESDHASAMPHALFEDLAFRFNKVPVEVAQIASVSWFDKVQSFIARPAFGVAALAVVILGIALPGMMSPATSNSGFRGARSGASHDVTTRIVLSKAPSATLQMLQKSEDFEKGTISALDVNEKNVTGPCILVDFENSKIFVINAAGEILQTSLLPAGDQELLQAITSAVSKL